MGCLLLSSSVSFETINILEWMGWKLSVVHLSYLLEDVNDYGPLSYNLRPESFVPKGEPFFFSMAPQF
ncbi:conserved hypothetical protein [Ricinus communis]|uniref:Uncharacterized protein n=1 Tax=Ricinus communis TaxID=3988 RepID=B9SP76_RICCO|nr:conserved hypothetical protein [Ricinus communis]